MSDKPEKATIHGLDNLDWFAPDDVWFRCKKCKTKYVMSVFLIKGVEHRLYVCSKPCLRKYLEENGLDESKST